MNDLENEFSVIYKDILNISGKRWQTFPYAGGMRESLNIYIVEAPKTLPE